MDEKHKKVIQDWSNVLVEFLDPLEVMKNLPDIFVVGSENYTRVIDKYSNSHECARIVIEVVLKSNMSNAFLQFIDAIRSSHKWLAELLCSDSEVMTELIKLEMKDVEYLRQFLTVLMPEIHKVLNASDVSYALKRENIFTEEDNERVGSMIHIGGNIAGLRLMISLLVRKSPGWWENFIRILRELNYDSNLLNLLESVSESDAKWSNDSPKYVTASVQEDGKEFNKAEPTGARRKQTKQYPNSGNLNKSSDSTKPKSFSLRKYQEELAAKAVKGNNVIINAPTGSGKTRVATHIIKMRFEHKLDESDPKIAFIVPTVTLCSQQQDQIRSYLGSEKWVINYLVGDSKTTLHDIIKSCNVIVMTPQILLNALKDQQLYSITAFDMLIMDECHRTRGDNPYNKIMQEYLKVKHQQVKSHGQLPQIIGLTATVGVGDGKRESDAIYNVLALCANLDAVDGIVTVLDPDNVEELQSCIQTAEEDNVSLDQCLSDPFSDIIRQTMDKIVEILFERFGSKLKNLPRPQAFRKGSTQYDQWCQNLPKFVAHSLHDPDDDNMCMDVQTCGSHLKFYNQALDLHFKCRAVDAVKFLQGCLPFRYDRNFTQVETVLNRIARDSLKKLQKCQDDPMSENKNLAKIEQEILETFNKDPDSRVMLNVSRRQYTEPIRDWLNESLKLQQIKLNAEIFTGVGKSQGGDAKLTHNKQEQIIEMFRNGYTKILVCTPEVASEGMDIQDCNLVICYNYMKNEISKLQVKGRARKKGGRMVQFSSRDVVVRDMVNNSKILLMDKVTRKVQERFNNSKEEYLNDLEKLQKRVLMESKLKQSKTIAKGRGKVPSDTVFAISCQCKNPVCTSSNIQKLETMYTCDLASFRFQPTIRPVTDKGTEKKDGIFCSQCDRQWGIFATYKHITIPLLRPNNFIFVDESNRENVLTGKSWKNIAINFKQVTYDEIAEIMSSALDQ